MTLEDDAGGSRKGGCRGGTSKSIPLEPRLWKSVWLGTAQAAPGRPATCDDPEVPASGPTAPVRAIPAPSRGRLDGRQLPRAQRGQLLPAHPSPGNVPRWRDGHRDASYGHRGRGPRRVLHLRRRRRHGRSARRREGQPDGRRHHPQGTRPPARPRRDRRPDQVQRAIRDAVAAANQEILGLSVVQTEFNEHGDDRRPRRLPQRPRLRSPGSATRGPTGSATARIEQLTKDHSLAQALLEAGTITAEELPNHKFKHVLYLVPGEQGRQVRPRGRQGRPSSGSGDRFLLASDGLTGVVPGRASWPRSSTALRRPPGRRPEVADASWPWISNSKDNVTCLVVHAV